MAPKYDGMARGMAAAKTRHDQAAARHQAPSRVSSAHQGNTIWRYLLCAFRSLIYCVIFRCCIAYQRQMATAWQEMAKGSEAKSKRGA